MIRMGWLAAALLLVSGTAPVHGAVHGTDAQCTDVRAAFGARQANAGLLYAMAFCAAREGDADGAFRYLDLAVARGYHQLDRLRQDPDFDGVHADPRWQPLLAQVAQAQRRYPGLINAELARLYRADVDDRSGASIDWPAVTARDAARRARVATLAGAGALHHADDYLHAALIFQHGDRPAHFRQAHLWARRAVERGTTLPNATWLACAAEDRWLLATGKAQVWGTQFMGPRDGRGWTMEPFDQDAKTDAQRVANGVPTLADSARELARRQ